MKIYSSRFELTRPSEKRIYHAPNTIYGIGVRVEKNGEIQEGTIKLFENGVELTPMETTVDSYVIFQRTAGGEPTANVFDCVYTKDSLVQSFKLIDVTTDSTVFDIDQSSGEFELPIASETVLGGVKVGDNLTIDADGTLNADAQELTPATTTTLGGVIVGSGLSVDENGKIDALAGEETDPVFTNWLSSSTISIGSNADAKSVDSIAIGRDARQTTINSGSISIGRGATCSNSYTIAIGAGATASKYKSIAIGEEAKSNNQYSIQFGAGTNNEVSSFQVYSHKVLDGDGNIPSERLGAIPTAVLSGTYSDDTEFSFTVYTKQA